MSFVYPGFLFALAAIAIPIIIHLFNFRRYKKMYFSNVRFLKEVQQETQSRNRLKQWLILISRILAITCLVLAFAQPFIPGRNQDPRAKGDKVVSVYLDNTFSMDSRAREGRLLELAMRYAAEIGEVAGSADRIQLLTADFEGRHQLFYSPEEYDNLLSEVKLSPTARPLSEVAKRQADLLNKTGAPVRRAYIISDFQKSTADFENFPKDSSVYYQLIALQPNAVSNLYIDSCWLLSPEIRMDEAIVLKARVVNASDQSYEQQPLYLSINGEDKAPVNFSVGPKASAEVEVNFTIRTTGFQEGELRIDDEQILTDNRFHFAFEVLEHIDILHIRGSGASPFIEKLFANDPYFRLTTVSANQLDYSALASPQMIILDEMESISSGLSQELKKYLGEGGTVFVIPAARGNLEGYGEFSTTAGISAYQQLDTTDSRVDRIETGIPFFRDVFESIPENMDMPLVRQSYLLSQTTRSESETLLRLRNGRKFFCRDRSGKGYAYLLSVSLQESFGNFPRHALFVPCVIKAAFSSQRAGDLYYTIGRNNIVQVPALGNQKDQVYHLQGGEENKESIPEQRRLNNSVFIYLGNEITADGIYTLTLDGQPMRKIALNYDRRESDPALYSKEEIADLLKKQGLDHYSLLKFEDSTFKKVLTEAEEGLKLWKLFIILALVFLGIEILLIRFLK